MKIDSILLVLVILTGFQKEGYNESSFRRQSSFSTDLSNGIYVWDAQTKYVWNDSIEIKNDSLIVYKDPKYGFGRIWTFTYLYKRLNEGQLTLSALTMEPEGAFVLPEQYDWHKDTLQLSFSDNQVSKLVGPASEEYKLNTTKPKLH
jgi:hypothetical protein